MDTIFIFIGFNVLVIVLLILKDFLFGRPNTDKNYDSVLGGKDATEDFVIYDSLYKNNLNES